MGGSAWEWMGVGETGSKVKDTDYNIRYKLFLAGLQNCFAGPAGV